MPPVLNESFICASDDKKPLVRTGSLSRCLDTATNRTGTAARPRTPPFSAGFLHPAAANRPIHTNQTRRFMNNSFFM
jgi:hypothetical protein